MAQTNLETGIAALRAFNRFYTPLIGLLNEGLLDSPYSLTEGRVLYELANGEGSLSAAVLARDLGLDPAYLSRILRKFRGKGLISVRKSDEDGRARIISLTQKGRREFEGLDAAMHAEVLALLKPVPEERRTALVAALETIRGILEPDGEPSAPFVIRPHRPGDLGWVVHRHGVIYTRDYGWDATFEGFVAGIAADFLKGLDPAREGGWIAERDGAVVGSVFIVDGGGGTAKLRMLYVEAEARGLGIGARLVEEAVSFSRRSGYDRITLLTTGNLTSARRIYEAAGFRLVSAEQRRGFGKDLVFETWTLEF